MKWIDYAERMDTAIKNCGTQNKRFASTCGRLRFTATFTLVLTGFAFLGTTFLKLQDYGYQIHGFFALQFFLLFYTFAILWTFSDSCAVSLFESAILLSFISVDATFLKTMVIETCNSWESPSLKQDDPTGFGSYWSKLHNDTLFSQPLNNFTFGKFRILQTPSEKYLNALETLDKGLEDITHMTLKYKKLSTGSGDIKEELESLLEDINLRNEIVQEPNDPSWTHIDDDIQMDPPKCRIPPCLKCALLEMTCRDRTISVFIPLLKQRKIIWSLRKILCVGLLITCPAIGWLLGELIVNLIPTSVFQGIDGLWDIVTIFQYINCTLILLFAVTFMLELKYKNGIRSFDWCVDAYYRKIYLAKCVCV